MSDDEPTNADIARLLREVADDLQAMGKRLGALEQWRDVVARRHARDAADALRKVADS